MSRSEHKAESVKSLKIIDTPLVTITGRSDGTLCVQTRPKLEVAEDMPAVVAIWDQNNVAAAVAVLNALVGAPLAALPAWVGQQPFTAKGLCDALMTRVQAQAGAGALIENSIIGPNDQEGFASVVIEMANLGLVPAFRGFNAANLPLAHCYTMTDKKANVTGVRCRIRAAMGGVQIIG